MAKFHGKVGYEITAEDPNRPGIYVPTIVERKYYGTITRIVNTIMDSDRLVDDFKLNMELELMADGFAMQNFASIRYVEYMNSKWEVTAAQVRGPRIIVNFGGVYNAESPDDAD